MPNVSAAVRPRPAAPGVHLAGGPRVHEEPSWLTELSPDRSQFAPKGLLRVVATEGQVVTVEQSDLLVDGVRAPEPYGDARGPLACLETGCVVPEGSVFLVGDNLSASRDSRLFGVLDLREDILGRAVANQIGV